MKIDWTGAEIKQFRKAVGMNQAEFAKAIGIDRQQSISEWEIRTTPRKSARILIGQFFERWTNENQGKPTEQGA